MNKIIFLLVLSLNQNLFSQEFHQILQKQMWYVKGDLYRGDLCTLFYNKIENTSGYLLFQKDELTMQLVPTDNQFSCSYEILKDKLKLFYDIKYPAKDKVEKPGHVTLYYKIDEISTGKEYLLTPITSQDYK